MAKRDITRLSSLTITTKGSKRFEKGGNLIPPFTKMFTSLAKVLSHDKKSQ